MLFLMKRFIILKKTYLCYDVFLSTFLLVLGSNYSILKPLFQSISKSIQQPYLLGLQLFIYLFFLS